MLGALLLLAACGKPRAPHGISLTVSGSAVGSEGAVLQAQLRRFMQRHPGIHVALRRTPDAADQRHQLYVQWLNAHAADPDVLQLDVIWTAEFAAAGWLRPLQGAANELADYFPVALHANRYRGRLFALPWFVDVGMLYYRSDLLPEAPRTQQQLRAMAARARERGAQYGLVYQGARYEGLLTVFLEYLTAYGGSILDARGAVALDSPEAHAALQAMRDEIEAGVVPRAVLGFQEEQSRFAFQNGHALFMRNWPYAYALMQQRDSRVAGRFGVAPIPPAPGGRPAAALGGSELAVNAYSDQPEAARALIAFLLEPAQMLERARLAGELPSRRSLYAQPALAAALPMPPAAVERIIASAVARPRTPVYAELSDIVQIHVHRCLSGQESPAAALHAASHDIEALFARVGLRPARARSEEREGDG